jgi:hypothetical protein
MLLSRTTRQTNGALLGAHGRHQLISPTLVGEAVVNNFPVEIGVGLG